MLSHNLIKTGTLSIVPGIDSAGNSISDAGDLIINPDGFVDFVPSAGFIGNIELTYQVCDDQVPPACSDELLKIEVKDTLGSVRASGENPPVANDDFSATDMNTIVEGEFFGNNYDPDFGDALTVNGIVIDKANSPISVQVLTTDEGGQLQFYSDGTYLYSPPTGFSGTDQVIYEICDTLAPIECVKATIH